MADESSRDCDERNARRNFLKTSSALLAAGTLASTLGAARNAHAAGSDEIKIGLIGCGGRGSGATKNALSSGGPVRLVAVADAFPDQVEHSVSALQEDFAKQMDVPKERQFSGLDAYRKVLATDCDLVILATPPGFRSIHFEAAVKAGKHVFMEKPVATDAAGVRRVLAANAVAKKKKLAVAVGLQRRHETRYRETIKRLQDGAIGRIDFTRTYWNSPGVWTRPRHPNQTELEYQVRNWYYFNWLCGDNIVEQHIHNLDVVNWLKGGYPVSANGMGGRQVRNGIDNGEIFDHHFVEFTYADGMKNYSQCRQIPGCFEAMSEWAHGTLGKANIGSGTIFDQHGRQKWQYQGAPEIGWQIEHNHLFASLRKGEIPNEGDVGALSTMTAIFGRMATYSGKDLAWNKCLHSKIELGVKDFLSFDDTAPVVPDADGRYRIPMPGITQVV